MSQTTFRSALSVLFALLLPIQLPAQDAASAMVYSNGTAWVNGAAVPKSVAVFNGDMLQTKEDSSANLTVTGSNVMVLQGSLAKYEGTSVGIDHGSVRISTTNGFSAHVCEVKVRPVNLAATEYSVTHDDGRVSVTATKSDVTIEDKQGSKTVQEGQQVTRDDGCAVAEKKNPKRRAGATTAAHGGIMSSPWAVYGGLAVVGGVTTWVLIQDSNPMSPTCPSDPCPGNR